MKIERCESWSPWGITLESADDEYREGCNAIVIYAFRHRIEWRFRELMKPYRAWIDTSGYEWSKSPAGGYWDVHRREYGFRLSEGFLQVFLGPQTHDSLTTRSWCKHLPWTQWRFHRMSYYGLDGEHLRSWGSGRWRGISAFNEQHEFEKTVPKCAFQFLDYDGQQIEASTHIQEREWKFGEGWFKWLSLIRAPKVSRVLDIAFSAEVGPRKGSWKGGTVGHSIEMLPGELHAAAFARYCAEHNLTLII